MQMHLRHIRGCNCNLHLNINMQRQLHLQLHLHFSSCICVSPFIRTHPPPHPPTPLTAPLANNKASTCVREQAQACGRHLISVPVNRCVICIEKDKNNLNEHKSGVSLQSRTKFTCWTTWLTETWHIHLTMTSHLDIWIVWGRNRLFWQRTNRKLIQSCQAFASLCFKPGLFHQAKVLVKTKWVTEDFSSSSPSPLL